MAAAELPDGPGAPTAPASVSSQRLSGLGSLLAGGLFVRVLNSVRIFALAPLLGPEAFGLLRLAQTAVMIASGVATAGLPSALPRFLPELSPGARRPLLLRVVACSLGLAAVAGVALAGTAPWVSPFLFSLPGQEPLALLTAVALPTYVALRLGICAAQGTRNFRSSAAAEALQNLLFLILGLFFLLAFTRTVLWAMGAWVLATAVAAGPLLRQALGGGAPGPSEPLPKDLLARAARYSLLSSLIPLVQYLFDFIDRWMIAHLLSIELAGVYSMGPALASGMMVLATSVGVVTLERAVALRGSEQHGLSDATVWRGVKLVMLGSLLYAALLRVAEPAVWWVLGSEWERASQVLPLLLCYFTFYGGTWVLASFASLEERMGIHVAACTLGVVANMVLNAVLIPRLGLPGAAAGTLVGYLLVTAVHLGFVLSTGRRIPAPALAVLALGFAPLLPLALLLPVVAVVLLACVRTSWLLSAEERASVRGLVPFGRRSEAAA